MRFTTALVAGAYAIDRLSTIVFVMIATRLWEPSSVGVWTQTVAATGSIASIAWLGLGNSQVRLAGTGADNRARASFFLILLTTITLAWAAVSVLALVLPTDVSARLLGASAGDSPLQEVVFLAGSELWLDFLVTQLRATHQVGRALAVMIGRPLVKAAVVLAFAGTAGNLLVDALRNVAVVQFAGASLLLAWYCDAHSWLRAAFRAGSELFGWQRQCCHSCSQVQSFSRLRSGSLHTLSQPRSHTSMSANSLLRI